MKIQDKKKLIIFTVLFIFLTVCFFFIWKKDLYDDEHPHFEQIEVFQSGEFKIIKGLAELPGYHLAVTVTSNIFHLENLSSFRLVSFAFSLLSIAMFYLLVQLIDRQSSVLKTLQYTLIPIQFPFLFLLYTEGFSNLAVFLMIYLVVKRKYTLGAVVSLIAVLIRQTNIIWMMFMFILAYLQEYDYSIRKDLLIRYLKKTYIFIIGFLLFGLFVYLNKGVAVRDQQAMPSYQIHAGSIYWTLFLVFVLFLPLHIANIGRVAKKIYRNKMILVPLVLFIIVGIYTIDNLHPMNTSWEHLRNRLLLLYTQDVWRKVAFFIFVSYTVLSLSIVKLLKRSYYLLYPFAVLSVVPFWLIESRYSLTAILLFMLFRKRRSNLIEYTITAIFLLMSLIFFVGYLRRDFYL